MTAAAPETPATLSDALAGEIRARLARLGKSQKALAAEIGASEIWLSRRISPTRTVALDVDDLVLIARALDTTPTELLAAAS